MQTTEQVLEFHRRAAVTRRGRTSADWRQFEELVARIEQDAGPLGLRVTSPDRIRCRTTGRLREVDASIRSQVGTTQMLVTIECRKRGRKQDVTWIEQLATKKLAIGADRTIAVSPVGFSDEAHAVARLHGIDLRRLSDVSAAQINRLLRLDFVLFTHKRCAITRVGIRLFRSLEWTIPDPTAVDFELPPEADAFRPIFCDSDTGRRWSLNDLWHEVQGVTNPYDGIAKGQRPVVRTACFPYPGNVTMDTADGPKRIGDVLLSIALWLDVEMVRLEEAKKVEYGAPTAPELQRVEFTSRDTSAKDWRISLQAPKDAGDVSQVRTGGNWPRSR
ncbi:MAG: restriction endonuclease [Propylenella sp.]